MRIKSLKRIKKNCKVYDIEVDVDHSFIVQECVLHNCLVCASLDGKLYKNLDDIPNGGIQHRGCRCVVIPFFDIENDVRESKDGYVSSKVTFADWLEEQDADIQKEVLGATRYKMYKDGAKITDFVDNGETLTLAELKKKGLS